MIGSQKIRLLTCTYLIIAAIGHCQNLNVDENKVDLETLLNERHYDDSGHHNVEFDHRAFAGAEDDDFHELSEEEATKRLGLLFDKIDTDDDNFIDEEELYQRIKNNEMEALQRDANGQFISFDVDNDHYLTWDEYYKAIYEDDSTKKDSNDNELSSQVSNDRKKFDAADENSDKKLSLAEFVTFMYPHNFPRMYDMLAKETMDTYDNDKNGKVSWEEYIGSLYDFASDEEVPKWVIDEKRIFHTSHDKDGDGFLNLLEIKNWMTPADSHEREETGHLIREADSNKDGKLSKEEVLKNRDLFIGHTELHNNFRDEL